MSAYDNMKKGLKQDEGIIMAEMMADMGFDAIEVSCGIGEDGFSTYRGNFHADVALEKIPAYKKQNILFKFVLKHFGEQILKPLPFSQSYNREAAREIKSKVNVPVFLVGGMTDPLVMEDVIEKGDADYISLSRALINNPNFPNKILKGSKEPSKCLHCNLCAFNLFAEPLRCYYGNKEKLLQGV